MPKNKRLRAPAGLRLLRPGATSRTGGQCHEASSPPGGRATRWQCRRRDDKERMGEEKKTEASPWEASHSIAGHRLSCCGAGTEGLLPSIHPFSLHHQCCPHGTRSLCVPQPPCSERFEGQVAFWEDSWTFYALVCSMGARGGAAPISGCWFPAQPSAHREAGEGHKQPPRWLPPSCPWEAGDGVIKEL